MQASAQWIADAVSGRLVGPDACVTGPVVTDSREASAGSLYVARRGENADGHAFVHGAIERGAVAVIAERELEEAVAQIIVEDSTRALGDLARAHVDGLRSRGTLDVIAMTGSVGKTTTKDLLLQILSEDGPTVAPKLSFNNEVGLPLTALQADETTRHLVLEMGASGPGHISYLTDIVSPDVAIELCVGHAHVGGFGGFKGVAAGALTLGVDLGTVAAVLSGARALSPHRMDVHDLDIEGKKLTLIDDSYNANLDSMRAGIAALASIGRDAVRIAVLGEMLELGEESRSLHEQVGALVADAGVDTLIGLGAHSHYYLEGASGVANREVASDPSDAARLVVRFAEEGAVVLVKGSYGSQSWQVADILREKGTTR